MVKHFKIKKRESLEIITSRLIEYIFENFLFVPSIMKIDLRKITKKIPKDYLVLKFPNSKDIRYRYFWNQKHII